MPSASCGFGDYADNPGQDRLEHYGPTLSVEIGFDPLFQPGLSRRPELPSEQWSALVDTGALASCIDAALAAELGLPLFTRGNISGVGGVSEIQYHLAQIYIPSLNWTMYGAFAGVHLSAGGQPHQALIGRDFLKNFRMTYEGRTGEVILSND